MEPNDNKSTLPSAGNARQTGGDLHTPKGLPTDPGVPPSIGCRRQPTDAIIDEMRAALALQIPRVRLTELEPTQQVAAGIVALIEQRWEQCGPEWLKRRTDMYDEIYRCLLVVGVSDMERALERALWHGSIRDVTFQWDEKLKQATATLQSRGGRWDSGDAISGDGPTFAEALGRALEAWDAREDGIGTE